MNRRSFLASLLTPLVLDPEKLLWVPGAKTIFIPKPRQLNCYTIGYVHADIERTYLACMKAHKAFLKAHERYLS